ncbi:cysteine desulfurase family protein [Bacillus cihuensis]|uniref:cysteine desulfurase family protein n=1 Tax=Bacillus cihuensis TaxID=1208599 RepID=UPI000422D2D1|nr:cysteine desulfurase family protein [Bacillus cihuensis]
MIYFDNSATTKPYPEVIDSFIKVSTDYFGNPSSLHGLGAKAENLLTQARRQVAELLQVKSMEICFTSGGTEGNNLAIKGAAHAYSGRGKHIITTVMEHASIKETCKSLEEEGYEITYLQVDSDGLVSVEELKNALRTDTILVSIMSVNNEVGSIQPIAEIGQLLKERPQVLFHVDHVQGIGKIPLDLTAGKIDLCTISGHKFHGLKGTGVLYIRDGIRVSPLFTGGNQEARLRSGTENVAGFVALAKALRLTLQKSAQDDGKLTEIREMLFQGLNDMQGVKINSPKHGAPHIINFSIPGIKSEVFIHSLEEKEIYLSTTSACSSKKKSVSDTVLAMFHDQRRAESVIRISTSYGNEHYEAELVLREIKNTLLKLQKVMR